MPRAPRNESDNDDEGGESLALPKLDRAPSTAEVSALLTEWNRSASSLSEAELEHSRLFAERLISDLRFQAAVLSTLIGVSGKGVADSASGLAAYMEIFLLYGARLGVLMERKDREGREVEEAVRGVEEATRRAEGRG